MSELYRTEGIQVINGLSVLMIQLYGAPRIQVKTWTEWVSVGNEWDTNSSEKLERVDKFQNCMEQKTLK